MGEAGSKVVDNGEVELPKFVWRALAEGELPSIGIPCKNQDAVYSLPECVIPSH